MYSLFLGSPSKLFSQIFGIFIFQYKNRKLWFKKSNTEQLNIRQHYVVEIIPLIPMMKPVFFQPAKHTRNGLPSLFTFSINYSFSITKCEILQKHFFSLAALYCYIHAKFFVGPLKLQVFNESRNKVKGLIILAHR